MMRARNPAIGGKDVDVYGIWGIMRLFQGENQLPESAFQSKIRRQE